MIASLEADRDATVTKVITEMKDEIEHLKQDRDTKVTELTAAMKSPWKMWNRIATRR